MAVLCFGEILWDIFADGEHLGGASYNVAAHVRKLGHPSYIYSRLGDDRLGEKARKAIKKHGVKTDFHGNRVCGSGQPGSADFYNCEQHRL